VLDAGVRAGESECPIQGVGGRCTLHAARCTLHAAPDRPSARAVRLGYPGLEALNLIGGGIVCRPLNVTLGNFAMGKGGVGPGGSFA
jgi:hypothetical protein